jgi:tetratricopeptide (TPR) repeat protein
MRSLTILCLFLLSLSSPATFRLQATAESVTDHVIRLDPHDGEWGTLARNAQKQLRLRKFAEAAEFAKQALQVAKRFQQPNDRLPTTYYQLGNIYRDWGHCAEARTNYSRAIATWEKQPEPKHKYIFNTIVSMLDTMCECEDYKAADKAFRTYEAKLQKYQSDTDDEVEWLSLRGTIYRAQQNWAQAEASYRRAMQLRELTPGSERYRIEEERSNLAMVIDKQGRHADSLAEEEKVIAYFERNGVSRPATLAGALNNAACSLADLGRLEEAQRMFERSLKVAVEGFGEDNRFVARIMMNYARVLRENKLTPAAEAMQKKGAETFRRAVLRDNATVDVADWR